jgi:hypothetical protein
LLYQYAMRIHHYQRYHQYDHIIWRGGHTRDAGAGAPCANRKRGTRRGAPVSGAGSFASPPHDCALPARACTHKLTTHRRTARAAPEYLGVFAFSCIVAARRGPRRPGLAKLPRPGRVGPHVRGAIAIRLVVTRATRTAYVRGANGTKREQAKQTER